MTDLTVERARYAEELRERSQVRSAALIHAFATVPREHYLGSGPWRIFELPNHYRDTPDADARHVYHDVLVAIDPSRFLNNGQPSAHALWLDELDLHAGEHVVHIGCGTGYYTAIMAEVVGTGGHVTGIEIDPDLAGRAARNLAGYAHVDVVNADGCSHDPGPVDAIYVNAGATHPLALWLNCLRLDGRLMLPLVRWPSDWTASGAGGSGVLLKITHSARGDHTRIVSLVGIFPCIGAVDAEADRRLATALDRGVQVGEVGVLRRDTHVREPACWLHGDGYCISARPGA